MSFLISRAPRLLPTSKHPHFTSMPYPHPTSACTSRFACYVLPVSLPPTWLRPRRVSLASDFLRVLPARCLPRVSSQLFPPTCVLPRVCLQVSSDVFSSLRHPTKLSPPGAGQPRAHRTQSIRSHSPACLRSLQRHGRHGAGQTRVGCAAR